MSWLWIIVGLIYLVSRIDLIPDVFFPWGWVDDGIVLLLIYRKLVRMARRDRTAAGDHFNSRERFEDQGRSDSASEDRDPYAVLELTPPADQQEIRAAYLKLANQYHPDKVAHLGKEFQELAEKRFKEIQQAYQHLSGGGR